MNCRRFTGPLAVGAACLAIPALADEASTTRIEPRVFYGATVTLEEGVRVFRPLPPHKHVIINPDSRAPVSLSFNELIEKRRGAYFGGTGPGSLTDPELPGASPR